MINIHFFFDSKILIKFIILILNIHSYLIYKQNKLYNINVSIKIKKQTIEFCIQLIKSMPCQVSCSYQIKTVYHK